MGTISALYKIESVFIAIGITAFVCLGVTLFTFQTKYDFTRWLGVVIGISWALLGFGIACIFTYSKVTIENNDV
jgi:Na+-translocating ferredoxin:NAD+ oxidoreductase RnfA subunit